MPKWRIRYDWSPDDGYDTHEENFVEIFEGTEDEMLDHLVEMRINGCYNIHSTYYGGATT